MQKSKYKKIISFSFLILFLISLVFPIASLAADPTLTLKLEKEDLNTQTDRWSWLISINTTNVPDNTSASIKLFKTIDAKTTEEESITEKIINNQAIYDTKSTLIQNIYYSVNVRIGDKTVTFSKKAGNESNSTPTVIYNTIIPTTENNTKTEENYYPLAPLPGVGENCTVDTSNPPKTTCIKLGTQKCTTVNGVETCVPCEAGDKGCTPGTGFAGYLNMMIKIFIGIAAVLSMIMIVMGGIEYMTSELVSSKQAGKDRIIHAILGLILALGSYAILNTLNPDLLNVGLGNLTQATVVVGEDEPQSAVNGEYCKNPSYKSGIAWIGTRPNNLPNGVTDNRGNVDCNTVGQGAKDKPGTSGCTSLKGINPSILITIREKCPKCEIMVTGGTECWLHSAKGSHKIGSPTIDLNAINAPILNKYITGNSTTFPTQAGVYNKDGVNYLAEQAGQTSNTTGKHWHVYK